MGTETPEAVLEQITAELGGSLGTVLMGLGVRCGLWQALAGAGPLRSAEVGARAGIVEPYAREWLRAQAAGGYLRYDAATDRFELPETVAVALLQAPGGAMVDACLSMFASIGAGFAEFERAFRTGQGYGWDRRGAAYWAGTDALTRAVLPPDVLAGAVERLPGVAERLRRGGRVADVGCGFGAPTIMLANAFPDAVVTGFDVHDASVASARKAAAEAGLGARVGFEVAAAADLLGSGYDLITFIDSLHDLGDPAGALHAARRALAPGGAVLLVEPPAGDTVADNLTPLGRMFYGVSTLVCTPNALSQGTAALGTLAGARRLTEVAEAAGFGTVRRVPVDAPMNLLLELRS
jgi:2-polyprenyl-3-methyl-5-hydroxy-6-metoxy-1,4-benzoquinol methylase